MNNEIGFNFNRSPDNIYPSMIFRMLQSKFLSEKMKEFTIFKHFIFYIKKIEFDDFSNLFNENIDKKYIGGDYDITLIKEKVITCLNVGENINCNKIIVNIFGSGEEIVNKEEKYIKNILNKKIYTEKNVIVNIKWYFSENNIVQYTYLREIIDDILIDSAYPYLNSTIDNYIDNFLSSEESVLLLMGEPGTGKTRFIRYLMKRLKEKEKQKNKYDNGNLSIGKTEEDDNIFYTNDEYALKNDTIYRHFLTSSLDSLMILEDVDYDLNKRTEGNCTMYKLLSSSDGLIKNRKRKIILSTNLLSTSKIDTALLRDGRCYDIINTRALTYEESCRFMKDIGCNIEIEERKHTLAELYKINNTNNNNLKKRDIKFGFGEK